METDEYMGIGTICREVLRSRIMWIRELLSLRFYNNRTHETTYMKCALICPNQLVISHNSIVHVVL
jgi:hypothetical protein